ncbi:MAG: hypothetical protein HZA78_02485 [Candidatus Schekmanbacteria bacterium]|nr:hypothetical protein [Candidatus Schekmanbacteria bacterium]
MNTILIPPPQNLIDEIVSRLETNGKDYSANLVVFPGKRPSHFLRKALVRKEKSALIPPQIFSMDEFIDFVYEKMLGKIDKKLEVLDAVAILHRIHTHAPSRFGGDNFLKPDFFFPLGFKLYHDLEELYIEGVSVQRVREIDSLAEETIPQKTTENLHLLSGFYETFYQKIKEGNYSTRSSRYKTAADADIGKYFNDYTKIIFAGFFALTCAEQSIFKHLMNLDQTRLIFQDGGGMKENLAGLGIAGSSLSPSPLAGEGRGVRITPTLTLPHQGGGDILKYHPTTEPQIFFYKSPDTHGQVYGVSRILKEKLSAAAFCAEQTVIAVPLADTVFPLYNHTLPLLDPDNYNISLGYPLHRTPLFGFLNNLMQLIGSMDSRGRFFVPDYLTFVLHPYTKNIRFNDRADITRMLFHTLEETLSENGARNFLSLAEIEADEKIAGNIKDKILTVEKDIDYESLQQHLKTIHQQTISQMLAFENIGDFSQKTTGILTYIYEKSTAPLHPFFYPYLETFITHLEIIGGSLLKEVPFEGTGAYFALFKRYIMTCHTPFKGTPVKGLQVLGFLETRNLNFDTVIFLDTNEEIIPGGKKEDSILPYKARRILGLPTYIEREKIAAYYFETLIKGAKEVHLFYTEARQNEKAAS